MENEKSPPLDQPRKDPSSDPDWRTDPFWDPDWKPEEAPAEGFWSGLAFVALSLLGTVSGAVSLFFLILLLLIWIASTLLTVTTLLSPQGGLQFDALFLVTLVSWLLVVARFRKGRRERD